MKLNNTPTILSLVASLATSVNALPAVAGDRAAHGAHIHKRAVQYVTEVTTVEMGTAQYNQEQQQSSTPTTLVTSVASSEIAEATSTGGSVQDFLDGLFHHSDSTTSTSDGGLGLTISASASIGFGSPSSSSSDSISSSTSTSDSEVVNYAAKSKGITYSPYTKSGSCKSSSQVKSDLEQLTAFGIIRLYGTDCSGIENVMANINSDQKVFLGIYDISDVSSGLSSMKDAVESTSRSWDAVDTVSIGNELVNAGTNTVSEVSSAVKEAKSWFESNASSFSGSIVSVDTLVAVQDNTDLCDVSDYIAVNSHPFWDGNVDPSDAGSWLKTQISNLKSTCGNNKNIVITETGWPTKGDTYGDCVPSTSNQLSAIKSISETVGDQVIMFTTFNDYWKDAGDYNVEQNWGILGDPSA